MIKLRIFSTFFFALSLYYPSIGNTSNSQFQHKAKASSKAYLISSAQAAQKGTRIDVGLYITLPRKWYTYWKNPGDIGQAPRIQWRIPSSLKRGSLQWPVPQRMSYDRWVNFGYYKHVLLKAPLYIPHNYNQKEINIQAKAEWIICRSVCIPFTQKVELSIPIEKKQKDHISHSRLFSKFKYPSHSFMTGQIKKVNEHYQVHLTSKDSIQLLDFFPHHFLPAKPPNIEKQSKNSYILKYKIKGMEKNLEKISALVVYKKDKVIQSQEVNIQPTLQFSLLLFLLFAFLGGVILNLMPCVLPVVFLKFYSTLSTPKNQLIASSFSYSLGIIASFLGLALIIQTLKKGSEHIGWGFQMQSPLFVTFLIFFFSFIALGFLGLFSIPRSISSRIDDSHHMIKNFISGFLASTAASPCTAPFMGAAIGYAFAQSTLEVILVFSALGWGMASPYIILSIFPHWLKYLPQPGKWNQTLKKAMAIPLFGTILWLINILSHLDDSWILPIILSLSGFAFAFWLKNSLWISRKVFILLFSFSTFLALFPSLFSNTLHQSESMMMEQKEIPFSTLAFHQSLRKNQSLLLYFTAEWCITCKVNEWTTLRHQKVKNFLHQNNISVMKGDWTARDPEISKILFQYGRASVPFMIFFKDQQEVILPTLLTPKIFINTLTPYLKNE